MSAVAPLLSETELRLVALCCSRRTGREVAAAWAEFTSGAPVSNGTLYTTLRRLSEVGLVQKSDHADKRARYFLATRAGREALARTRLHHEALARFAQVPA